MSNPARITLFNLCSALLLLPCAADPVPGGADFMARVGQPVDIAPSAYHYRADRNTLGNAPEAWIALLHYAHQPLNNPPEISAPPIKRALCALLWEEIRPIEKVELSWAASGPERPAPEEISITTLEQQGTASSWWNNLRPAAITLRPTVSADGRTYSYDLRTKTCGVVISVAGARMAADCSVPDVRVFVADTWKKMDFEVEWGYEASRSKKDYSGSIELYDGRLSGLASLSGDSGTRVTSADSWDSPGQGGSRRGVRASLLFVGASKWRRVQPFTTQADDVARTIVTIRTRAGSFSFLAGDLENGPILAPEYGFFVRRSSDVIPRQVTQNPGDLRKPRILLQNKMTSVAGNRALLGWGSDDTPWFGANPTAEPQNVQGIAFPPKSVAMHPGSDRDVAVGWRSPVKAKIRIQGSLAHAQKCSNGIEWSVARETTAARTTLAHGFTEGTDRIPRDGGLKDFGELAVEPGDMISLIVGPKGLHHCDTMIIDTLISEIGGQGRVWDLRREIVDDLHAGNPHDDGKGQAGLWWFYSEKGVGGSEPSEPPIELASKAKNAKEFLRELEQRKLSTVREKIRTRREQTWEGAVGAMRGTNLPPHPPPPAGSEPAMQVQVPCPRLTAQWNLGTWHLLRHAERHPQTGRLWFNDHPYGVLGAETYMVLAALDLMGAHQAAEDGFEQWISLPMDPKATRAAGHHEWALADRPNGLFSEGHGCLTHAVGPPGAGNHMDGVHAFGPGSIGWALVEHYLLTGNAKWFRAAAPRMKANAEWMLRQRNLLKDIIPDGERLWCKGLQPALQVTPDSGGLWMQFYECEAYYWVAVAHFADALATIDPVEGARLQAEAKAYRRDLSAAFERSITLSPVVPVRDGTFHSVVPFACYVRGLATGAWGWQREGSGAHVGPLYWDTVQSAAALVSPAGLLSPSDPRVQGYFDVLEDRLLLENAYVGNHDWFAAGWQYQGGLERTPNLHLAGDDIPVFLRSFLNCYAIDILPKDGYIFNEHAVHGPPDKIFEEAAFLERFRNLLVMEDGNSLWVARGTPREWLEQGKKITVRNAPTHFGTISYEIASHADKGQITATVELPSRQPPKSVLLRLRHPSAARIKGVTVNGKSWKDFGENRDIIRLEGLQGTVNVTARY